MKYVKLNENGNVVGMYLQPENDAIEVSDSFDNEYMTIIDGEEVMKLPLGVVYEVNNDVITFSSLNFVSRVLYQTPLNEVDIIDILNEPILEIEISPGIYNFKFFPKNDHYAIQDITYES